MNPAFNMLNASQRLPSCTCAVDEHAFERFRVNALVQVHDPYSVTCVLTLRVLSDMLTLVCVRAGKSDADLALQAAMTLRLSEVNLLNRLLGSLSTLCTKLAL